MVERVPLATNRVPNPKPAPGGWVCVRCNVQYDDDSVRLESTSVNSYMDCNTMQLVPGDYVAVAAIAGIARPDAHFPDEGVDDSASLGRVMSVIVTTPAGQQVTHALFDGLNQLRQYAVAFSMPADATAVQLRLWVSKGSAENPNATRWKHAGVFPKEEWDAMQALKPPVVWFSGDAIERGVFLLALFVHMCMWTAVDGRWPHEHANNESVHDASFDGTSLVYVGDERGTVGRWRVAMRHVAGVQRRDTRHGAGVPRVLQCGGCRRVRHAGHGYDARRLDNGSEHAGADAAAERFAAAGVRVHRRVSQCVVADYPAGYDGGRVLVGRVLTGRLGSGPGTGRVGQDAVTGMVSARQRDSRPAAAAPVRELTIPLGVVA